MIWKACWTQGWENPRSRWRGCNRFSSHLCQKSTHLQCFLFWCDGSPVRTSSCPTRMPSVIRRTRTEGCSFLCCRSQDHRRSFEYTNSCSSLLGRRSGMRWSSRCRSRGLWTLRARNWCSLWERRSLFPWTKVLNLKKRKENRQQ